MSLDTESELVATKIAFDLLAQAYADLAAIVRDRANGVGTAAFNTVEREVADRLTRFLAETPEGAARPDILAESAQKVRGALRRIHGARDGTGLPN